VTRFATFALLAFAATLHGQPKETAEAFRFDPIPEILQPTDGATKLIQAIAYSPDGSQLAVGGEGGEITLWNVADHSIVGTLVGHTGTVSALAWSKDGQRLASVSGDKTAIVWNVSTRKPTQTLPHAGALYALAWSPDDKVIATGGFDTVVRLWDADTGQLKAERKGHTASVRSLAFNPNGEELASGGSDFTVRCWSLKEASVKELRSHSRPVRSIAYLSPRALASGGDDGKLLVWNISEGEAQATFGPFADGVQSIAASPKGTFLVAGLGNGRIQVLDPVEQQTRAVLTSGSEGAATVAVSPNGRAVAAGGIDRTVRIWSTAAKPAVPAVVYSAGAPLRATAISADGKLIATGASDGTIHLFDAETGVEKATWPAHKFGVEDLGFSADGSALISGGSDRVAKVWRPATHELIHTLPSHPGPVRRVALSANGKLAATASTDNDVRVHDLTAGTAQMVNADGPAVALQFLGNDALVTAAGKHVYWWDIRKTPRVEQHLDGDQFERITGFAGTADGLLFAIAGDPKRGTQRPEDVGYSRVIAVSRHHAATEYQRLHDTGVGVSRVAVSADGRIISCVGGDGMVRAWEWPTLAPMRKFASHESPVLGLAISSRGEFLVTASADGTARRWNASRGDPLIYAAKLLDESKQAWFARVSPDGKTLITGGDDKVLRIRDAVAGAYATLTGDFKSTSATAVSPDGTLLATGHFNGTDIHIWDLQTNKLLKKLKGPAFRVYALAFSADGTRLVSGGGNYSEAAPGELFVWDTATWKTIHVLPAHDQMIYDVAVSPDNKRIATCSQDHSVRTWDMTTGKEEHILKMHTAAVATVAFSRDGKRLYSGGFDGRLQWWDPEAGKVIDGQIVSTWAVRRIRLSPDGKTLALALNIGTDRGLAALWDMERQEITHKFPNHAGLISDVVFAPNGKTLVSVGGISSSAPWLTSAALRWEPGPRGPWHITVTTQPAGSSKSTTTVRQSSEVHCWDLETKSPLADLAGPKHFIEAVQFTGDGSRLITAGGSGTEPGEIRLYEFQGVRPKAVLAADAGLTCGKFSPDGALFATGGADGSLTFWDVAKASRGRVIPAHKGIVRNLAWSPDGARLFTSGEDGAVRSWNPKTGEPGITITAADRAVYGLAISPDGKMIATAAGDWKNLKVGQLRCWNATTGAEELRLPDTDGPAWGVAFSTDGHLFAAQIGAIAVRVFDLKTKKEVTTLAAGTDARGLALSPDGKRVGITSQSNGLLKIWDARTGREDFEVTAHPGKVVFAVDFAVDGQTVLTAGGDGAAVIWKIPGGTWKLPDRVPAEAPPGTTLAPPPQFNQ
jgi:WD40 repeat protein